MWSPSTSGATRFAVVAAGLTFAASPGALVPVGLAADSSGLRLRSIEQPAHDASAAARSHAAVLTLYGLETELAQAGAEVAATEARRVALAGERASARRRLALARKATRVSEARLHELVRRLYVHESADPLALLLGAGSLNEALVGLDNLERAAVESRRILERAGATRARLERLTARLEAREAELARLSEAARSRLRALEAKVAERAAYVASLRRDQVTGQRLAAVVTEARAAERRTATLAVAPRRVQKPSEPAAPVSPISAPVATSGRSLVVSALGYSLRGRTASGLAVGHGTVAVDTSVIPLGTRFFVPGYGEAVAADTGSAIRGAVIDLWFPTDAAARRWGRRTVTIAIR